MKTTAWRSDASVLHLLPRGSLLIIIPPTNSPSGRLLRYPTCTLLLPSLRWVEPVDFVPLTHSHVLAYRPTMLHALPDDDESEFSVRAPFRLRIHPSGVYVRHPPPRPPTPRYRVLLRPVLLVLLHSAFNRNVYTAMPLTDQ
ncbi:hypothetical protein Hypma_014394 [Hypsizygus marmoreus]|uniref:Uncharacterized protein n=1 Tax=Hypsizygus marmoreus TaxID=39966 RepID=A0A369JF02_HYPMA|nr:hypothetical protein Hypma_014394 [Hypsizygus marmoreus]